MGMSIGDIPLVGSFLGESRADKAGKRKQMAMEAAAEHYAQYRPIQFQQRQNAMANTMAALQPMNNALGQMYGQGAQLDMNRILQSPVVTQNLWPGAAQLQQNAGNLTNDVKKNPPLQDGMGADGVRRAVSRLPTYVGPGSEYGAGENWRVGGNAARMYKKGGK